MLLRRAARQERARGVLRGGGAGGGQEARGVRERDGGGRDPVVRACEGSKGETVEAGLLVEDFLFIFNFTDKVFVLIVF